MENRDIWTDEMIISRAKMLAKQEITLGEVMGVTEEEISSGSALGLMFASHGRFDDAETVMEGVLALEPQHGLGNSYFADILFLAGKKEKALKVLEQSKFYESDDFTRLIRADTALALEAFELARYELSKINKEDIQLSNRKNELLDMIDKAETVSKKNFIHQ